MAPEQEREFQITEVVPGAELKKALESIFPKQDQSGNEINFLREIDDSFNLSGALFDLVYRSIIAYLIRRLINTTDFYKRRFSTDDYPAELYVEELRNFFQGETQLEADQVEKLLSILQLCLSERKRKRKTVKKQNLLSSSLQEKGDSIRCYICGVSLAEEEIEIEHEWPKDMGGSYVKSNLKVSCSSCNRVKENYIDSGDFHFEHVSLRHNEDEKNFWKEFKGVYRIAICSHNSYSCSICGKTTSESGRLNFARRNLNDSWHFLNILTICNECNESTND